MAVKYDKLFNVKSFSPTNLKYMRYLYELYPDAGNRQQFVDDLENNDHRQQLVDDLGQEIFSMNLTKEEFTIQN